MEEKLKEELTKSVIKYLESENVDFESAVTLAANFSIDNSISSDSLLELSDSCGSSELYSLAYIFARTCSILSTENTKKATAHYFAGFASLLMGRNEEAENEYKLALEADPNGTDIHSNYGTLLIQMKRPDEAEKEYKLALITDPKHASTHSSYGNLLQDMGRYGEAENEYKLALEANPNYSFKHNNYGNLLHEMGRNEEAEKEYKLALKADFKNATRHYNYGRFLQKMGREGEAEKEYKLALEADPRNPYNHVGYSLVLLSMNLEKQAIEEAKAASRKFKENQDITREHLSIAWLYEELANKYYCLKNYQDSSQYAEISGNEYLEGSKYAEESLKGTLITKGYTLKARAKIRELEIKPSFYERAVKKYIQPKDYEVKTLKRTMDCIMDASDYYEKAAEISPENNQICIACSTSMSCLSDMFDYMLVLIKMEKEVPELGEKVENWKTKLIVCREIYKENKKGEAFIQSLEKLQTCIKNLEVYKRSRMRRDERAFEECIGKLLEAAMNMEGPLQKILENSAEKMNIYRLKNIPYTYNQVYTTDQNRYFIMLNKTFKILKMIVKNPIIPIFISVIAGLIVLFLKQKLHFS